MWLKWSLGWYPTNHSPEKAWRAFKYFSDSPLLSSSTFAPTVQASSHLFGGCSSPHFWVPVLSFSNLSSPEWSSYQASGIIPIHRSVHVTTLHGTSPSVQGPTVGPASSPSYMLHAQSTSPSGPSNSLCSLPHQHHLSCCSLHLEYPLLHLPNQCLPVLHISSVSSSKKYPWPLDRFRSL